MMDVVYMILGMTAVTFGIRYLLLPLSGRIRFSYGMQRALQYVPSAVLTAIIVPAALMPGGGAMDLSLANAYMMGAVITVIIGKLGNNLLVTILGGMAAFALWQWGVSAL